MSPEAEAGQANKCSDLLYRTSQFLQSLPFIIIIFSRGLLSLSVFLIRNAVYFTVVSYSAFNDYLIRIKRPLNLSPGCKFKW